MGGTLCKESCDRFRQGLDNQGPICSSNPWYANVQLDWNGCRKFNALPPPGQHPRLFFTKDEIPHILARFTHSEISSELKRHLEHLRNGFLKTFDLKDDLPNELHINSKPSRQLIEKMFIHSADRNICMLGAYVYGRVYDEPEISDRVKTYVLLLCQVFLTSREIALEEGLRTQNFDVWHMSRWDVRVSTIFGGICIAVLYDIMFNELTKEQQTLFRSAITTAVSGRMAWGMDLPSRRIQSNWAAYHGDLYIMAAVTEGEDGFEENICTTFSDLLALYLNYAIYDSGHPIEDAYAINLGFREGSLCFLAMARRGYNIFNHPHFKRIFTAWVPYALEPNGSGAIYGGSSGSIWHYPTSAIMVKYMFPKDPTIDYIYSRFMCLDNKNPFFRLSRIQCRLPVLAFALPPAPLLADGPFPPLGVKHLPLDFVCRDRGKVIMLSEWSSHATNFTFDARADGFLIGHDACSRGNFVLYAGGRTWGYCPEWKWYRESSYYSLPRIDGAGQTGKKAPFSRLLNVRTSEKSTFASADLKYAFNWTWTYMSKEGDDWTKHGFEAEPSDPHDFGYNVWWSPNRVFGERHVGFEGLFIWRKRAAFLKQVTRSTILVRGSWPFVIITDDIVNDDGKEHDYEWAMTTPCDVTLLQNKGFEAVLGETGEMSRRMVVRSLGYSDKSMRCSFITLNKNNEDLPDSERPRQVIFAQRAHDIKFIFLLYDLDVSVQEDIVQTKWVDDGTVLEVTNSARKESRHLKFAVGKYGETTIELLE